MSSNVNVLVILTMGTFPYMHEFLGETWKIIRAAAFPGLGQRYSQVVPRTVFSTGTCFQEGGIASAEFPWLVGLAIRQGTGFLIHLCYQLRVVNCSASEHQSIRL